MRTCLFHHPSILHLPSTHPSLISSRLGHSYPVHVLSVAHFVQTAASLRAVAASPCSAPSLLAVAGPRRSSVRGALGNCPVAASSAASRSASGAEVCLSHIHSSGLHRPHHGTLILDHQGVVWLASGEPVAQLCQACFKRASWGATEDR